MSSSAANTRADVAHLARLARLALTDDELDHFAGAARRHPRRRLADQRPRHLRRPADLARPDLTNVEREDVVRPGLTQEEALAGAPAAEDGRFRVPRILGEEA